MYKLSLKFFAALALASTLLIAIGALALVDQVGDPRLSLVPFEATKSGQPLTGIVYRTESGRLAELRFFWRGKQQGPELHWYPSGRLSEWIGFRDGLNHGAHRSWHESGNVQAYREFERGQPQGEAWVWDDAGKLRSWIRYVDGKEVAAKDWDREGVPIFNYVIERRGDLERTIGLKGGRYCKSLFQDASFR